MTTKLLSRPVAALLLVLTLLAAALGTTTSASSVVGDSLSTAADRPGDGSVPKPTVVLVHGAFADSSGWNAVLSRLMKGGYPVVAFSNPLRGPAYDGEYLREFLSTIEGPIVLVGHSYGGAVITNAATGNDNVRSLVYVAAYAPAEGETVAEANNLGGGHTTIAEHLVVRPYPNAPEGDADASIDPEWYPRLFAPDIPRKLAKVMAATQRPASFATLVTPTGEPAWKTIPSYAVIATQDQIIPPEAERAMAKRAGSTSVEIDSSHVVMMSHPSAVAKLIVRAAGTKR